MRIAIIDLGTNTFNLLVAERIAEGRLAVLHSDERAVFLGRNMVQGAISPEATERAVEVLHAFHARARAEGSQRIQGFGTSALRSATNADAFIARVQRELGFDVSVIPGEEEAELILLGARQAVNFTTKPMLVMDIGGGSIEFILATDKSLMWKRSFELGATRLLERFRPSDPMTVEEHFRIAAYLDAQLEPLYAVMDRHWPTTLVGSAGSFDTLASMIALEQGNADSESTHSVTSTEFGSFGEHWMFSTRSERSARREIPSYRVDTFPIALIAMERLLAQGIEEIRWSRYALKEGAAWRFLQEGL